MTEDIRLNSSKLGTQEYWNNFYKKEQQNFKDNEEDTGECWFDDSDAESKMIQFLIDKLNNDELPEALLSNPSISFLDLGTGNGHLLFQLLDDIDYEYETGEKTFKYTGIDYSPDSVEFAKGVAAKKYPELEINFEQVDLLQKGCPFLTNQYDVLLDKGTLDAIALNQDPIEEFGGKIGMEVYASQVEQMMKPGSILLITSCNFTDPELTKIITNNTGLKVWDKINYPSFEFGGVQGSTVVSIAFIKN
ncbi:Protein-lysine N-methyltransferase EFM4 [Candida viswanathii]|uniref:Protein-lysine N-methyltransferase EFM4 n=1 Tax=Candida viswanathii TaxID=5486 RepID=A0A367YNJ5_9ASCO|nr:Protein-lysine N-methyltransferase EFM4 [Candida viswanathii]